MKVKVRSLHGDTDFIDIVAGALRGHTLSCIFVHNLPTLCTSNVDRSYEKKWFYTKKARSKRYTDQTIKDIDYANDIVLLANAPTQAESLMHSMKQAASDIGLQVNSDKT